MKHPNDRANCGQGPLTVEHDAAYDFVELLVPKADKMDGLSPMWYGWALREAFLAGVQWRGKGACHCFAHCEDDDAGEVRRKACRLRETPSEGKEPRQ